MNVTIWVASIDTSATLIGITVVIAIVEIILAFPVGCTSNFADSYIFSGFNIAFFTYYKMRMCY
jgi:hypothetical protein